MKKPALVLLVSMVSPFLTSAQHSESPADHCDKGLEECVAEKREQYQDRGMVGLMIRPAENQVSGGHWKTCQVLPGGAAEDAGIEDDDVIVAWNGKQTATLSMEQMLLLVEAVKIGDSVKVEVLRDGGNYTFSLEAREPGAMVIEQWLLGYVYDNYSESEFRAYEAKLIEKYSDSPDSPHPN